MSGHVSSLESGKLAGHSLQRTEALEDQELVGRYLDGDVVAFDELMTRHQRSVFRLCLRFAKNHDDALDLTQEVFIKAFERLVGFRGDARFRTWIYRVAVNHCLNWVKKNSREFVEVTENTGSVRPSVDGALLRGERRAIVSNLIEMLPPKQKVIFRLRMQENLSYEEIAAIVGRSVSTVKSSVFFAMTKLRKLAANSNVHPNGRASR
jgi:RNA polymerase sigma-70 factor (ECF subfamily)